MKTGHWIWRHALVTRWKIFGLVSVLAAPGPAQTVFQQRLQQIIKSGEIPETIPARPPAKPAAMSADAKPTDTLELVNGDTLRGTFLSLEPELGVRWRHEAMRDVLSVIPAKIRVIRLHRARPQNAGNYNSMVLLSNGDKLAGNLISLDDTALQLETWYAGTLTIPRKSLQSLVTRFGQDELVYEGPSGLDGWTQGAANRMIMFDGAGGDVIMPGGVEEPIRRGNEPAVWQFKDDAFQASSSGALGRDVKLPPLSNIEFDLQCQNYPQFAVQFYTDAVDKTYGNNCYMIQFSQRTIYLRRYNRPGTTRSLGTVSSSTLMEKTKVRVSIRTDRQSKTVTLFLEDALVKKWTDIGEMGANGTGLMFWQQGNNLAKVSNIRITRWNGELDAPAAAAAAVKEDAVLLKNQDKLSGQLTVIKNNVLEFKTSFSELKVPVDRVSRVDFASANSSAASGDNPARLNFHDYGRVTLQLERWDDQKVEGTSPIFGKTKFNATAFNSLQLGP